MYYRKVASRKPRFPGYMNKRGQFYIIAAVFIVLILFGMTSISTYAVVKPEPRTIKDISAELNRETYNVIEYGIFNQENLITLSESFIGEDVAKYFLTKINDANIVFVYGNKNNIQALHYRTANTGKIKIGGTNWQAHGDYSKKRPQTSADGLTTKVEILDTVYDFELRDNEMFYFIIVQKRQEEVFIERN